MHFDHFRAMTTEILFAAEGRLEHVRLGFREARAVIRDGERRFTRFSPDSELMRLNRSSGKWREVSQDMFDLLLAAQSYVAPTRGLFNPAVLAGPGGQRLRPEHRTSGGDVIDSGPAFAVRNAPRLR